MVLGPIQQVVELVRNATTQQLILRIDGVELRRDSVWPLNNRGNITIHANTDTNTVTLNQTIITLQLATPAAGTLPNQHTDPLFAYSLDIVIDQPTLAEPANVPLCHSLRLTRLLSSQAELGVLVDGWRAEYVWAQPDSASNWTKQGGGAGAIVEPAFGLDYDQLTVSGLSLFSYPLMASRELPVTSVSFFPLSCSDARYIIPRMIHETWFGPLIPAWIWINSWRRDYLHRYSGWSFLLWREASVQHLRYLDRYLWDQEQSYNGMSDISRSAATRAYGGMYIDADSLSLEQRPLDELYVAANGTGFFIAREKPGFHLFAAGVFGTVPNHDVVRRFQDWQHRLTEAQPTEAQWRRIGPGASTHAIGDCHPDARLPLDRDTLGQVLPTRLGRHEVCQQCGCDFVSRGADVSVWFDVE